LGAYSVFAAFRVMLIDEAVFAPPASLKLTLT
jgi:hypothetical protein